MKKHGKTTDGLRILDELFLKNDLELQRMVKRERRKMRVASQLYRLRKDQGLTQTEVAKRIGTSTSVISRIEDSDYDGHNLATVERFCQALGYELHTAFKPRLPFSWTLATPLAGAASGYAASPPGVAAGMAVAAITGAWLALPGIGNKSRRSGPRSSESLSDNPVSLAA